MKNKKTRATGALARLWMIILDILSLPWWEDRQASRSAVLIIAKLTTSGSPGLRVMSTARFLRECWRRGTHVEEHQWSRLKDGSIAVVIPIHSDGRRACPKLPDPRSAGELNVRHHVVYNLRRMAGGGDSVRLDFLDPTTGWLFFVVCFMTPRDVVAYFERKVADEAKQSSGDAS